MLWPPDHRLVAVADVVASDSLSGVDRSSFSVRVVSNEPVDGDILVTGGAIAVRAARLGAGPGREYVIDASVGDRAGNFTRSRASCVVPHDEGR